MSVTRHLRTHGLVALAAGLVLAACGGTTEQASSTTAETIVQVDAGDEACDLSTTEVPSGTVIFEVTNTGTQATEFYLLGDDDRVISEVEDIGPGLSREMEIVSAPGTFTTACKPGMVGDGIRGDFTITGG